MTRRSPRAATLIPLLGLSTVLACCGLAHYMARCQKLNHTMMQRDRELARLILKVLNLQESLQQSHRMGTPILRHTGVVPGLSVSACVL